MSYKMSSKKKKSSNLFVLNLRAVHRSKIFYNVKNN